MGRHRYKASLVTNEMMEKYCIKLNENYHPWQYLGERGNSDSQKSDQNIETKQIQLKLSDYFSDPDRPLVIEIGSGNGDYLIQLLENEKNENIISIEMDLKMVRKIVWRLDKREASDIAVYWGQAENLLKYHLAKGSVSRFHIHFPDPWPKEKHLKRRIYQPELLKLLHDSLKENGQIITATDYESYGYEIRDLFKASPLFKPLRDQDMTIHDHPVLNTNFESKALETGGKVYYMEYVKQ